MASEAYKRGKTAGRSAGFKDGRALGFEEGRAQGIREGHDEGYRRGERAGRAEGQEIGRRNERARALLFLSHEMETVRQRALATGAFVFEARLAFLKSIRRELTRV